MSEKSYGRKIIRNGHMITKKNNVYVKRFFIIMGICFLIGAFIGSGITKLISDRKASQTRLSVSESQTIILNHPYGFGDNREFTSETPMKWSGEEIEFISLDVPMNEDLQEFIFCLCEGYNIDFALVMAMIAQESSFRADAVSETNDYGLMQINQCNHKWLSETIGVTDFLDAKQNVRSGMYVLQRLFEKYDDTNKVLMAYNMGENGAGKLWEQEIFSTSYTKKITQKQYEFQKQLEERKGEQNDN